MAGHGQVQKGLYKIKKLLTPLPSRQLAGQIFSACGGKGSLRELGRAVIGGDGTSEICGIIENGDCLTSLRRPVFGIEHAHGPCVFLSRFISKFIVNVETVILHPQLITRPKRKGLDLKHLQDFSVGEDTAAHQVPGKPKGAEHFS